MEIENLIQELETMPQGEAIVQQVISVRDKLKKNKSFSDDLSGQNKWGEWHEFGSWNDSALLINAFSDSGPDWTSWTQWGDAF